MFLFISSFSLFSLSHSRVFLNSGCVLAKPPVKSCESQYDALYQWKIYANIFLNLKFNL